MMEQKSNNVSQTIPKSGSTLKFQNFRMAYDSNVLFENFEYEFKPGVYAFSGTSGVGKTTLMRCIAGLEMRYTGEILLNNEVLNGTTPEIHMVHQHYTSFPWLNCLKNVLMVCKGHKVKITEEHIEEAKAMLIRFGLGEHIYKIPSQISGGQDQRLSLCSAFINPWSKVILYDEPSSALDSGNTKLLAELIREHQAKYQTIEIIITHDQDLLNELKPIIISFTPEFRLRNNAEKEVSGDEEEKKEDAGDEEKNADS